MQAQVWVYFMHCLIESSELSWEEGAIIIIIIWEGFHSD